MGENIYTNGLTNIPELVQKAKNQLAAVNEAIAKLQQHGYTINVTVSENNQIAVQATKTINEAHAI